MLNFNLIDGRRDMIRMQREGYGKKPSAIFLCSSLDKTCVQTFSWNSTEKTRWMKRNILPHIFCKLFPILKLSYWDSARGREMVIETMPLRPFIILVFVFSSFICRWYQFGSVAYRNECTGVSLNDKYHITLKILIFWKMSRDISQARFELIFCNLKPSKRFKLRLLRTL